MKIQTSNYTCIDCNSTPQRSCRPWWNHSGFHLLAATFLLIIMFLFLRGEPSQQAESIGPTAQVELADSGLPLLARIDTGAASTALHACDIRVKNGWVSYAVIDEKGTPHPMRSPLVKRSSIRNVSGETERLFIDLAVRHNGTVKHVTANLSDRSSMNYRLLLGRDFLAENYLVDVSRPAHTPATTAAHCPSTPFTETLP